METKLQSGLFNITPTDGITHLITVELCLWVTLEILFGVMDSVSVEWRLYTVAACLMTDMWSRDGLACSMRSPDIGKEEILTVRDVTNSDSKTDCSKLI